jgi:arylsulfatase A-like enzyme
VPDAYRQADEVLGEILDTVGWETNIVVLSDHGFRAANEDDAARYFIPLTSHLQKRLENIPGPSGFPMFKGIQVQRLGKKLVVSLNDIDLNAQRKALNEYLDQLIQESTGEPLFVWEDMPNSASTVGLTFRVEELDNSRLGWDSVLDKVCWDNPALDGSLDGCTVSLSKYAEPDEPHQGEHDANGIILASGPSVEHEIRSEPAQLIDVAPTLLTLLGLPTSDDMKGKVLWGNKLLPVPAVDYMQLAPSHYLEETDLNKAMEQELEALGYIE